MARKRSIITDILGLLVVLVTAAGVQDSTAGGALFEQAAAEQLNLQKVWVDGGYCKHFVEHAAEGENALQHADGHAFGSSAAVLLQFELALEGVVDRLDQLPQRFE